MAIGKCVSQRNRWKSQRSGRQILKVLLLSLATMVALSDAESLLADEISRKTALRQLENQVLISEPRDLMKLESQVTRIIQEEPRSAFGHYLLAHLYLREFKHDPGNMGKLKKASELAQQAIDLNADAEYGYLISSQVLDIMGYSENALRIIDPRYNEGMRQTWRTKFLRSQLLAGKASHQLSISLLKQALKEEPSASEVIAPYVIAHLRDEYQDQVQFSDELAVWVKEYQSVIFKHSLALSLSDQGEFKKAIKLYRQIQKTNPENFDAVINEGILVSESGGNVHTANRILRRGLALIDPQETEKTSLVKSHLARNHLKLKEYDKARNLFVTAISESPSPMEWLNFAHGIYSRENLDKELSILLTALKSELPGESLVYAIHGELLSEKLASHPDAIQAYQNAILLDPERSEFYNGLGLAYYRLADMDQALNLFNHAAKIDPRDATARYNEACVLALLGHSQQAIGSLKEAISLDPRLQLTAREDNDFNSIRTLKQFEDLIHSNRQATDYSH